MDGFDRLNDGFFDCPKLNPRQLSFLRRKCMRMYTCVRIYDNQPRCVPT